MLRFPLLTALLLAAPVAFAADVAPAKDGLIVSALDPSVPPCENFFLHACNGWLKANPIPPDQVRWGMTDELIDQNREKLRDILEQAATHPDAQTQKIGAFWTACLDEAGIEAKGLAPGSSVKLDVWHKGESKTMSVSLGELPNERQAKADEDAPKIMRARIGAAAEHQYADENKDRRGRGDVER